MVGPNTAFAVDMRLYHFVENSDEQPIQIAFGTPANASDSHIIGCFAVSPTRIFVTAASSFSLMRAEFHTIVRTLGNMTKNFIR